MKIFITLIILTFVHVGFAGTISGTVRAKGRSELEEQGGKYDSRKFKFAEKVDYEEMRDFVVYIDQPPTEKVAPPAKPVEVVTQKDATFSPHVLPVMVGTTVNWPNQDDIFHNVFSFSEVKEFDLGLYKKGQKSEPVTFDKAGRVDVFCSIHKDMHCIVLAIESPYFAATDSKNRFSIKNIPAGKYRLKAWHERMPSQVKEIIVPENGEVKVDFLLGFAGVK